MHETKTETLPLRHQQANENINNFYSKEMEANLIENNSSDLSLHVNKGERRSFADATKLCKLPCVFAVMGAKMGRESLGKTWKADTKNPRKKQTKEERKTNKKLLT